ncbi:MAG: IS630 family transposase, partial [Methylobacter sp.]
MFGRTSSQSEAALKERPRPGQVPKLTDKQAAHLIAIACSDAPEGHDHWTLRLLADQVVALDYAASCSYELIRRLTHRAQVKNTLKPWQKQEWCIPDVSAEFVAAMEDVLDLYEEPCDPARPVVCFDESPKQLIAEVREPIPVEPGTPARYDTEYERKGVCDLMMICEPKQGFRQVDVTDRRTKIDFAHSMKHVVERYPEASLIRVVLD